MSHVAIAGAGLAGRLLAWRLARAGWRVSLFDAGRRDDGQAACAVAAAMLSPLAEMAVADEAVYALGRQSLGLWPAWLDALRADSGRPVYFRREGTLVVAHAADAGELSHFGRLLAHRLPAADQVLVRPLDAPALARLEPALAPRFSPRPFLD